MITVLALVAKFWIAFPFNAMMIITSELHPTGIDKKNTRLNLIKLFSIFKVIRNTMVSFCTTISQIGSIIAPQIYLLVNIYILKYLVMIIIYSF